MNKYKKLNNKKKIADACLRKIREALGGISLLLKPLETKGWNYELHIPTRPSLRFKVSVKSGVVTRNQALHEIIQLERKKNGKEDVVIFSEWVPDRVADEFRKAGISYVDAQGNLYLWKPPLVLIDVRGNRPDKITVAAPGRLIDPGGLKVIHYLLTQPQALRETLREIAGGAQVALGTAHVIMHELEGGQWLLPSSHGGRRFRDRGELIDLFVKGYALKLRPTLFIGKYRHVRNKPQDIIDAFRKRLNGQNAQWALTGGMGARALTHYIEPDVLALFVDEKARHLLGQEPLLRDDSNGNVILLNLFTPKSINKKIAQGPTADSLLIYAELLQSGHPRDVETAGMIYDQMMASGVKGAV